MTLDVVVALDVGGTSVKSALVSLTSHAVHGLRETPINSLGDADTILTGLIGILQDTVQSAEQGLVVGVGVGFPGPFDYPNGVCRIRSSTTGAVAGSHTSGRAKFESIYALDLRAAFRAGLGLPDLPIAFGNDAAVALMGEARYGAGRDYHRLIGLTLGTGLGSAFLVDGKPVEAGPGVPPHGWLYSELYQHAPADDAFSAGGLRQRWQEAGAAFADAKAAAEAARGGAMVAQEVFEVFGADLGSFLQPYARQFGAQAIMVLGGLTGAFDLFRRPMTEALGLPVHSSRLGQRAALLGAADLLMQ